MSPELISIIVLVAMFIVASAPPINLGAMAFTAAYLGAFSAHHDPGCSRGLKPPVSSRLLAETGGFRPRPPATAMSPIRTRPEWRQRPK